MAVTTTYRIETFGRVYRSNGPAYGPTGSIGGLTIENVFSHIHRSGDNGANMRITGTDGSDYSSGWAFTSEMTETETP